MSGVNQGEDREEEAVIGREKAVQNLLRYKAGEG